MARVDPHLIHACEITPDVQYNTLKCIEDVQIHFLTHLLSLSPRVMRALLYIETGIMPIAYHCILLTLCYLDYTMGLPPTHLANWAWRELQLISAQNNMLVNRP
jgi:hypothetical protein